jgi:hypothetical protein
VVVTVQEKCVVAIPDHAEMDLAIGLG